MNYTRKTIKIKNLIVNPENYRHNPVENEEDALKIMLDTYEDKIRKLFEDILKDGTNPSDLTIVTPNGNKFIVLEGNRRLIALKIINDIDILKFIKPKLYSIYKKIIDNNKSNIDVSEIECCVFEDAADADKWIELKHTGENKGVGTVQWNTLQRKRFDESLGKNDVSLDLINYIQTVNFYRNDLKGKLSQIKLSNLKRLITDPHIRESIGLDMKCNALYKLYPDFEVSKGLNKILNDLLYNDFNVNDIYYKKQRQEYISKFTCKDLPDPDKKLSSPIPLNEIYLSDDNLNIEHTSDQICFVDKLETDIFVINTYGGNSKTNYAKEKDIKSTNDNSSNTFSNGPSSISITTPNDFSSTTNIGYPKSIKVKKAKKDINLRDNLIPKDFNLKISHDRINSIYIELKTLKIDHYANSVSVLFRVFIEVSCDFYVERHNIKLKKDVKLKDKIQECCNDLSNKQLINPAIIKAINICVSSEHSIFSTNTFNSYVHNKEMRPSPLELKISWNKLSEFIRILHSNCE